MDYISGEAMRKTQTSGMTAERFSEILATEQWVRPDTMVEKLDAAGYWDDALAAHALAEFKKEHVRRMARTIRRDDGRLVFVHVVQTTPTGEKVPLYKQQALFNVDDYRYAVNYHKMMGIHHMVRANELARDCRTFTGKQVPMPFPSMTTGDLPDIRKSRITRRR